jgi:hypothetical protein
MMIDNQIAVFAKLDVEETRGGPTSPSPSPPQRIKIARKAKSPTSQRVPLCQIHQLSNWIINLISIHSLQTTLDYLTA